MRISRIVIACKVLLLTISGGAGALTEAEINAGVQFNFSTPGARSLGLGGAFLALADDATAAYTNPAGLTVLARPEVSLEARRWSATTQFTDEGRAFGAPSEIGTDTLEGIRRGETSEDTIGASFLSYVYPQDRWAIAVYRHELANFKSSFRSQGAYLAEIGDQIFRLFPVSADMDLEIVNFGVAGAFQVTPDLSLGLGLSFYDFDLDSTTRRFSLRTDSDLEEPGGFFGPPDFSEDNIESLQQQRGSDNDVAVNLGLVWRASPTITVGAVYRQGPSFEFDALDRGGSPAGPDAMRPIRASNVVPFRVPNVFGAGLAFRPTDPITVTLDINRIEYSRLTSRMQSIFFEADDDSPAALERADALSKLKVDDGTEIRLGFEYVFLNLRNPLALRLGVWHDPDHRIRFEGDPETFSELVLDPLFFEGDDEVHVSVGLGYVIGDRFQIDAAFDFSELIDSFSLSGVLRF